MNTIKNRYDFVILFDVENGNPNGDPDAGNAPRYDSETSYGYVTDVCIKRKIRNYVELVKDGAAGYGILIKPDRALNTKFEEAYKELDIPTGKNEKSVNKDWALAGRDYICKNYFDVRAFGAVMSTGKNPCGVVRGPVQINFARSISPIMPTEIAITRQARTTEERQETGETEIGHKYIVPYALYRAEGHISASLAQKVTGLSEEDVDLLWNAIINMFEEDHSAARGKMRVRGLYVFKHDSALGNCPSGVLFDKIVVKEKELEKPARTFDDYAITIDEVMPNGVTLEKKV